MVKSLSSYKLFQNDWMIWLFYYLVRFLEPSWNEVLVHKTVIFEEWGTSSEGCPGVGQGRGHSKDLGKGTWGGVRKELGRRDFEEDIRRELRLLSSFVMAPPLCISLSALGPPVFCLVASLQSYLEWLLCRYPQWNPELPWKSYCTGFPAAIANSSTSGRARPPQATLGQGQQTVPQARHCGSIRSPF